MGYQLHQQFRPDVLLQVIHAHEPPRTTATLPHEHESLENNSTETHETETHETEIHPETNGTETHETEIENETKTYHETNKQRPHENAENEIDVAAATQVPAVTTHHQAGGGENKETSREVWTH